MNCSCCHHPQMPRERAAYGYVCEDCWVGGGPVCLAVRRALERGGGRSFSRDRGGFEANPEWVADLADQIEVESTRVLTSPEAKAERRGRPRKNKKPAEGPAGKEHVP